jgi:hypothetical protein
MLSFDYKKFNTLLGWLTFAVALTTYVLTLEPTVSYWDCGEYIATSVKLEVGHPPGAPLFQMMGAFFAMFTTEPSQIAMMVNFMSALASAFTILFLFWTITALAKKVVIKTHGELNKGNSIAILGSGLVGALAYAFSDSFWFSAVEAEVYAMSSFLMALLLWLALHWEAEMDKPRGNKWLLLISFIVGLSFGVHILSLLVIPSIVFIYIYKKYPHLNLKEFILANVVSILVLAFVFKLLFPYTLSFFSASELFFINTLGLPFNSGSIIAGLLLVGLFYFGLRTTRKKKLYTANLLLLSVLFIMIGFSSWLMLPIRANANTTINENNPSSARELLAYYNREQYGDANVFYGSYYSETGERDKKNPTQDAKPKYEKDEKAGKYVIVNNYKDALPNYSSKHKGIIPRMVDPSEGVVQNYKAIAGIPQRSKRRPTFGENISFMIKFQFGYMYGRYFMWNFVGKQNDIQGNLDNNGNWLSGITPIDEMFLGTQKNLPSEDLDNKGRNKYYFLPLILGIIGLLYHIKKDINNFYILLLFFAFTGLAIIFYTNPKPFEPRERDYAVVGSFYVFAIWLGFGVLSIYEKLMNKIKTPLMPVLVTLACLLAVPVLMAKENWDDHDRSGKYATWNNAKAYLDSCQENAIMFTIGDNDTFPLWYMQEVENYRTDIKLVNTSLFAKDWYVDQQKRKTYKADPIPSQLTHDDYKEGSLDVAYHYPYAFPQFKDSVMDIEFFMRWIQSKDSRTYIDFEENGHPEKVYPTTKLRIMVDKEAVLRNGIVAEKDSALIEPYIDIQISESALIKNRIMMLDILANNNWERPLYFTGGAQADQEYIWLKDYLQLDGLAYKFVPIKTTNTQRSFMDMGRIDTDTMYANVMKWSWKNSNANIYIDPETRKNGISFRNSLGRLADELIKEKDFVRAEEILDMSLDKMPMKEYGYFRLVIGHIESYYNIDRPEKARKIVEFLIQNFKEKITYYSGVNSYELTQNFSDLEGTLDLYKYIIATCVEFDTEEYSGKLKDEFMQSVTLLEEVLEE